MFFAWALASALGSEASVDAVVVVQQGSSLCAGTFIDAAGTVATSYHCVAAGGRTWIELRDGTRYAATPTASDISEDLALLRTGVVGATWVGVRSEPPAVGDPVLAVGHPFGASAPGGFLEGTLRFSVVHGVVSAVGDRAIQVDAPLNHGNSGGPIFDEAGMLVGVVSRRLGGSGIGFATRGDALLALVDAAPGYRTVGGTLSLGLHAATWGGRRGTNGLGGMLELAFRDRIVANVGGTVPLHARWDAVSGGEVRWLGEELRLGARQRLFSGPRTVKLDAYGGVATVRSLTGTENLDLRRNSQSAWMVGGAIRWPGMGVGGDVAWVRCSDEDAVRAALLFTWPGTVWMF